MDMKKESPLYAGSYKAAVIISIIISVLALILAVFITYTQRYEVYIHLERKALYDRLIFIPFAAQTGSVMWFLLNRNHLVKTGKWEHKLSRLAIPLIVLSSLETISALFVLFLYPVQWY